MVWFSPTQNQQIGLAVSCTYVIFLLANHSHNNLKEKEEVIEKNTGLFI